jgi:hypothetical protein
MGKTTRLGTLGFATAVSAVLLFPGTAAAAPGADPVIHGNCHATVEDESGKPVTVDVTALVDKPGLLDLGLGGKSEGAGDGKPTLSLPVADVVQGLGLSKVPVVSETTAFVCDTAKTTVNTLAAPVQDNLPSDDTEPPANDEPPAPPPSKPAPPTPAPPNNPGTSPGGGDQLSPVVTNPYEPVSTVYPLGTAISATSPLLIPQIPGALVPPAAPSLNSPESVPPKVQAQNSGTAQALPPAAPPARLPLLLAVLALAVVAAALIRTWMRRKSA